MPATTLAQHSLSAPDRAAMAALRAAAAPLKGKLGGPEASPMFTALLAQTRPPPSLRYEAATVGGVPGWWCHPATAPAKAAILYLHGGAYVLGLAESFRSLAGQVAARTGAACFVADYRLAPEYPFPASVGTLEAAGQALDSAGEFLRRHLA